MKYLLYVVAAVIGYLFGSLNFSIIIGKLFYKIDVREHGSKNAGATNTLRTLGTAPAVIVLIMDTFKAVAAYGVSYLLTKDLAVGYIAAVTASLGHNYPIYFGFKGGKGVTVSSGAVFCFNPLAGLCVFMTGVVVIIFSKFVSLGSILAAASAPLWVWFFCKGSEHFMLIIVATFILALQIIVRHHQNIKRLITKTENKISFKKK